MASAMEGAFASPSATARQIISQVSDTGKFAWIGRMSGWSIVVTLLLGLIAYDQCELAPEPRERRVADH